MGSFQSLKDSLEDLRILFSNYEIISFFAVSKSSKMKQ